MECRTQKNGPVFLDRLGRGADKGFLSRKIDSISTGKKDACIYLGSFSQPCFPY